MFATPDGSQDTKYLYSLYEYEITLYGSIYILYINKYNDGTMALLTVPHYTIFTYGQQEIVLECLAFEISFITRMTFSSWAFPISDRLSPLLFALVSFDKARLVC